MVSEAEERLESLPTPQALPSGKIDPYAAIREPNYRQFASGFLASSTGLQMMGMALGWELYERTGDEFVLGLVGLCRALPVIVMALPAGHVIDSMDRRRVLVLTQTALGIAAACLCVASAYTAPVWFILVIVSLLGFCRSFNGPARSSLLPDIVTPGNFANAVTWNSGVFQLAATGGPLLAGVIIAACSGKAWPVYLVTSVLCLTFAITASFIRPAERQVRSAPMNFSDMSKGLSHVWKEKAILSTITLDLFAVLLGGATALLPVYAKDILHVGAIGLGWLRASPYIGAFVMAVILAHLPPIRRAGMLLLACVFGFGVCTIIFGIATSMTVALIALIVMGALDNVSVVIRHVLVQARTPANLRGRVSAVNSVFIESSNELGAFESGLVARFFGPVASVVSGGIGTLVIVAGVALLFPQLRRLDTLEIADERAKPAST